jgi:hypothetical protein
MRRVYETSATIGQRKRSCMAATVGTSIKKRRDFKHPDGRTDAIGFRLPIDGQNCALYATLGRKVMRSQTSA